MNYFQNTSDVLDRMLLRKRLKCHNFSWYLETVFPEKYIPELREGFFGGVSYALERGILF